MHHQVFHREIWILTVILAAFLRNSIADHDTFIAIGDGPASSIELIAEKSYRSQQKENRRNPGPAKGIPFSIPAQGRKHQQTDQHCNDELRETHPNAGFV